MATKKNDAPKQGDVLDAPSTNLVEITIPTPAPLMPGATEFLSKAGAMVVSDPDQYKLAAEARALIRSRYDELEKQRVKLKAPSLEAGRRVDEFFKPALEALGRAGMIVTAKLEDYDKKQREIAAQKQREADEAARKERERKEAEARAERERAAAAERERERAAAAAKAEEDRKAREAAEARAKEEEAKRKAAEAAAAGDKEAAAKAAADAAEQRRLAVQARAAQLKAEEERESAERENQRLKTEADARQRQLDQEAANVVAEKVEVQEVEVAGLSRPKVWKWKLVDKSKLNDQFLLVDEKAINRIVSTMKERAMGVVGNGAIEVFQETGLRQG